MFFQAPLSNPAHLRRAMQDEEPMSAAPGPLDWTWGLAPGKEYYHMIQLSQDMPKLPGWLKARLVG